MARRAVMKESWKCRSGRAWLRTNWTGASSRGGKSAGALRDDEGETGERDGHVMVPAAETTAFEVVEPQLAFQVFVCTLGTPTLFDDTYSLLVREPRARLVRKPQDVMLRRYRFAVLPFHQ